MYIKTTTELRAFVERAKTAELLAVDTEFLREKTYYAQFCLLQLGTENESVIIDPLVLKDLSPLKELFCSPTIVKLFHAATQDVEILYREFGVLPKPLFDTQIAATLLGYGNQVGYAALVLGECNVALKKSDSFTDWSLRPLSASQLTYAAEDVIYLPKIYRSFIEKLTNTNRLSWLDHAFDALVDESKYVIDARQMYKKLKRSGHLTRRQLSGARELTAWREMRAQRLNIPRKWVLSDEQIIETCRREPSTLDELYLIRGNREKLPVKEGRDVVELLQRAFHVPESELPQNEHARGSEENVDLELSIMMPLIISRARRYEIAQQTLASHADCEALARGYTENNPLLEGWRYELVGKDLVSLLEGKLSLRLKGSNLELVEQTANNQ